MLGPAAREEVCEPGTRSLLTCSHAHALSEEGDKSRRGPAACWTWGCWGAGCVPRRLLWKGTAELRSACPVTGRAQEQRCRDVTTRSLAGAASVQGKATETAQVSGGQEFSSRS